VSEGAVKIPHLRALEQLRVLLGDLAVNLPYPFGRAT
jgi:hypothetical protein